MGGRIVKKMVDHKGFLVGHHDSDQRHISTMSLLKARSIFILQTLVVNVSSHMIICDRFKNFSGNATDADGSKIFWSKSIGALYMEIGLTVALFQADGKVLDCREVSLQNKKNSWKTLFQTRLKKNLSSG